LLRVYNRDLLLLLRHVLRLLLVFHNHLLLLGCLLRHELSVVAQVLGLGDHLRRLSIKVLLWLLLLLLLYRHLELLLLLR
jgi:hypothetical protein